MGELGLGEFGTATLVDIVGQRKMAPTENFRKTFFPEARPIPGRASEKEFGFKKHGCAACPIQCKKLTSCGRPVPEYENAFPFRSIEREFRRRVHCEGESSCNIFGMDTISAAVDHGRIRRSAGKVPDRRRDPRYGQEDGYPGSRRRDDCRGIEALCAFLGKPQLSMSVKGLELPAYDPRGSYGIALAYGTSTRGGCHLRAYPISQEILRKPVAVDRFSFDGKARMIKIAEDNNAVVDSLSICAFAFLGRVHRGVCPDAGCRNGRGIHRTGPDEARRGDCQTERRYNRENGFTQGR